MCNSQRWTHFGVQSFFHWRQVCTSCQYLEALLQVSVYVNFLGAVIAIPIKHEEIPDSLYFFWIKERVKPSDMKYYLNPSKTDFRHVQWLQGFRTNVHARSKICIILLKIVYFAILVNSYLLLIFNESSHLEYGKHRNNTCFQLSK